VFYTTIRFSLRQQCRGEKRCRLWFARAYNLKNLSFNLFFYLYNGRKKFILNNNSSKQI
jgi:hypothetical protein